MYQCCQQQNNNNAIITAFKQQQILLSEQNRPNTNPRVNFKKDLIAFIKSRKDTNPSTVPIIIGDWNEEFKDKSTAVSLCNEFGLVNIFERMYPEHDQFRTYKRGSKILDYALTPPDLVDQIVNFVYEPFLYRFKGDHRGFYFDISEKVLFGNSKSSPFDFQSRGFVSKDVKNAKNYLKKAHLILIEN